MSDAASVYDDYLRAHPRDDLAVVDLGEDALTHVHLVEPGVLVPLTYVEGLERGDRLTFESVMAAAWEAAELVAADGVGPALSAQTLAAVGGNPLRATADPQRHVRLVLAALDGLRGRGLPRHEGRAYLQLGRALEDFGLLADAVEACERGRALLEQAGDRDGLRAAYARLAALTSRVGLPEQALLHAEGGLRLTTASGREVPMGQAHFTNFLHHQRVRALTRLGFLAEADEGLADWSRDSGDLAEFDLLAATGAVRTAQDRNAEALDAYLQAIDARFTDADLGSLSRRSFYLENSVTLFGSAAGAAIAAQRLDLAVGIVAVLGTRGTVRAGQAVPPESVAALDQIQAEISTLARRATSAAVSGDTGLLTVYEDRARQLLDTRDTLLERAVDGHPPRRTVQDVAAAIVAGVGAGELALSYATTSEGNAVLFAVHDGNIALFTLDASAGELDQLALAVREECLTREGSEALSRLAAVVLEPVAELLADASRVYVTAHGALADVPFHAAPFHDQPLVASCEVRALPSLAPLGARDDAQTDEAQRVAVAAVGQPRYDVFPELGALPAEVAAVRAAFPAATVRMDDGATAAAVVGDIAAADVMHLAGHAAFEPARPLMARIFMVDRPLFAFEVACAARAPRLVNLSGCRAGAERRHLSGEGEGLGAAFLAAGAKTVVAPLWPVRDDAALSFNEVLYRELSRAGATAGEAVRRAQLELLDDRRFAHPGLWGAFSVLGTL